MDENNTCPCFKAGRVKQIHYVNVELCFHAFSNIFQGNELCKRSTGINKDVGLVHMTSCSRSQHVNYIIQLN